MPDNKKTPETEFDSREIAEISRDLGGEEESLLSRPNVVGVGIGHKITGGVDTGELSAMVLVTHKLDPNMLGSDDVIPDEVGGTPTDVYEVGELQAGGSGGVAEAPELGTPDEIQVFTDEQAGIQLLRTRVRPAEGGYSVGHYRITAGTIATAVTDSRPYPGIPSRYYILSNNHVLANSNNARIGDPILQPGPYDGGRYPADVIARLSRFVPIRFGGQANYVDAAIASGPFNWLDREIYWIGYVKGTISGWPRIGSIVQKTGRTTNYTTGRVTVINATVNVNYGGGKVGRFVRQIVTTNMSAGGDSGSLTTDMNENAVGLLFAGSSVATIHNHIYYVQALLGIRVV